jgi:hypothetical protein
MLPDPETYAALKLPLAKDLTALWDALPQEMLQAAGLGSRYFGSSVALVAAVMPSPFFNRLDNLGVHEPASEALLDEALEFQRAQGLPFSVTVHPAARPAELTHWLEARGLREAFRTVAFWRGAQVVQEVPQVRIEPVTPELAETFGRVAAAGFGMPEAARPIMEESTSLPGWQSYLAFLDDEPVGVGQLVVREGAAYLASGATILGHRSKGVQSAMLARRLQDAIAAGAVNLFVDTAPDTPERPNPSYRNVVRAGFRPTFELAYYVDKN